MLITSELYQYMYTTLNYGIQLTIHPPNEEPLPDIRGIAVTSGTYTVIELAQVNLQSFC